MNVALIPARSGSKRVPNKNVREFNGHPLMAYAIWGALKSNVFTSVVVSTDSAQYGDIAHKYGADVVMRPPEMATDISPDIEWVAHALGLLRWANVFSILRVTSPFRQPNTIRRAMEHFTNTPCDSLRAIAPCGEHPGKMWVVRDKYMTPLLLQPKVPWHSSQKPTLPMVYTQTSGLEIAWAETVFNQGTIAGERVIPFMLEGAEAHDINTEDDWLIAENWLKKGARLPEVKTV